MPSRSPSDLAVLVIEDQAAMRKIIKTVLQHAGVKNVTEAANGNEGLQILIERNKKPNPKHYAQHDQGRMKKIDLVICDWRMPKLTGVDLLRIVREDIALRTIPFFMLTSENDRSQIIEAIELGVTDYITKPFTPSVLEAKLFAFFDLAPADRFATS